MCSARSKTRSSLSGKWLVTVIFATPAAAATSAMVTLSKPRSANSAVATLAISSRVCRFLRSRSPEALGVLGVSMPPY
jgi:hypothetical protein